MPKRPTRPGIIGVGNLLYSDEGVGVHAARHLLGQDLPSHLLVLDGGTEGLGLMDVIASLDRLVIMDCVQGGQAPGTLYQIPWQELPGTPYRLLTSMHQTSIVDVLQQVALIAPVPPTTILGVEPLSLEIGMELSPAVRQKVPAVARRALDLAG